MGRPISSATKFILSLPLDLPVKDVIAKAKANGIAVTDGNVYRVRRLPVATKGAANTSERPVGPPSWGASSNGLSKSEFIRRLPATTPAKDVVAQARAAGLHFDQPYVYKIRAKAEKKAGSTTDGLAPRENDVVVRALATTKTPLATREWGRDLENHLASLDAADAALRALYVLLSKDPDLAPQHEADLRELHSKRSDLARQVGMAALSTWRASQIARQTDVAAPAATLVATREPELESSEEPEAPAPSSPAVSDEAPADPPPAPVSARQLADFVAGVNAPVRTPILSRPDDRTLLLALAAHVSIRESRSTVAAFEAEVEQIERATAPERQKRWLEMTREGQVRWLSVLVAWAKALEEDVVHFREATLGVSSVFRDLRAFSIQASPGFVHGFARAATPRSATWRADALRLLREIRPDPLRAVPKPPTPPAASAAESDEDEEAPESQPLADWPYLDRARGLRVVLLGGEVREERRVALEQAFQFESLEWIPRNRPRQVASLAERAARGTVDFILVTKFVAHSETEAVARATKVPLLTMRHGYGVTTVRQVLEEHFVNAADKAGKRSGSAHNRQ